MLPEVCMYMNVRQRRQNVLKPESVGLKGYDIKTAKREISPRVAGY